MVGYTGLHGGYMPVMQGYMLGYTGLHGGSHRVTQGYMAGYMAVYAVTWGYMAVT